MLRMPHDADDATAAGAPATAASIVVAAAVSDVSTSDAPNAASANIALDTLLRQLPFQEIQKIYHFLQHLIYK